MKIQQSIPNINTHDRQNESSNVASAPKNESLPTLDIKNSQNDDFIELKSLDRNAHAAKGASNRNIELTEDGALKLTISVKKSILSQPESAMSAQANIVPKDVLGLIS